MTRKTGFIKRAWVNLGWLINYLVEKTTGNLVDADQIGIADSGAGNASKKIKLLSLYNYILGKLSAAGFSYLATDTYANLVANFPPGAYANCSALCTSALCAFPVFSNNSRWVPEGAIAWLDQLMIRCYVAPTFTGSTNGAIVLGTALNVVPDKCFMYFPASSLVAGQAAGFYPVVMSSTTAGVAYNNAYVPAVGTRPSWPGALTAFAGAVPGGLGVTSEVTAFIFRVPANILGLFGSVVADVMSEGSSSANNKTLRLRNSAGVLCSQVVTTSPNMHGSLVARAMGAANRLLGSAMQNNAAVAGSPSVNTCDTTADMDVSVTMQLSTATDWLAYDCVDVGVRVYQ